MINFSTCLWFDKNAKEAAEFYSISLMAGKIVSENQIVTSISVSDVSILCLNGGPMCRPNASISMFYLCETIEEIDSIWEKFANEGFVMMPLDQYPWAERYGFVQDKFGVSWQFYLKKSFEPRQKIAPCLLFVGEKLGRAGEAIKHYQSIFKAGSEDISHYCEGEQPNLPGSVKHAIFELDNTFFRAMDGVGEHKFDFNDGVSLVVNCENQAEIDYYWEKLAVGGSESQCGWLKDKFGISWQIVPKVLPELMNDPERSIRVMEAFTKMKKFDIQALLDA
jgi:predicted 3-demethylubiquinone-9 3-methyltransferase (glyoxalase superfamily)